ncbi:MAG: response regulator, partial [Prosthecobacter sp.]|nr:response regulator [Prosthecobacter sp.]
GGEISVVSEDGKGSDFFFELPLQVAADDESREEELVWLDVVKNRPVTIYSAHPTTLQVLNQSLIQWGMSVTVLRERSVVDLENHIEEAGLFILDVSRLRQEEAQPLLNAAAVRGTAIVTLMPITHAKLDRDRFAPPPGSRHLRLSKPLKRRDLLRSMSDLYRMPRRVVVTGTAPVSPMLAPQGMPMMMPQGFQSAPYPQPTMMPPSAIQPMMMPQQAAAPVASAFVPAPSASPNAAGSHAASGGHDAQVSNSTNRAIANAAKADANNFASQNPARILLVEDQPLNQKIAVMLMQRLGYTKIDIANNGEEAVEMSAQGSYDIIFMDLQMPVMGGIEATRRIRGNFQLKNQPAIIAMTGHALTGVKEECREAGMNAFLTKPVSLDDFRRVIPPALSVEASK